MTICQRCLELEAGLQVAHERIDTGHRDLLSEIRAHKATKAELEVAKELAMEAVEARDIGRAALRLMEAQLAEWKAGVVAANRISQAMEARAVKAEAYLNEMTSAILEAK